MIDWIKKKILNKRCLGIGLFVFLILFFGANYFFYSRTGMWFWEMMIYQPLSEEEIQERIPTLTRKYPDVLKGNWEPNASFMQKMILKDSYRLKELGLNTVSVAAEYEFNKDGTYFMRDENKIRSNIVRAKEEGFAAWVAVSFVGGGDIQSYEAKGVGITLEDYLEASSEVALKWAEIAEEFNVEYFGPQNELDFMISMNFENDGTRKAQILANWYKQILPRVREVYAGRTIVKFAWVDEIIFETAADYKGYDYVGMALSQWDMSLENYKNHVREQYDRITSIAIESDSKWMVLEEWHPYSGNYPLETNTEGESLDDLQDDYYRISIEEYLKIEENKPVGYIFHSWIMPGSEVKDRDAEGVLRDFFNDLNK